MRLDSLNSPIVRTIESPRVLELARKDASVSDWFKLLRRRRKIVLYTLLGFLTLATLKAVFTTPRYQAVGELQIQKESSSALGPLESGQGSPDGAGNSADALDYNITLQTQVGILESDTLAMGVIKDLGLEPTEDFFPQKKSFLKIPSWVLFWKKPLEPLIVPLEIPSWVFFWKKPLEPLTVPLDQAPNRRSVTLKIFSKNLKIEPISGTRLIDISYKNPDPKVAADVVNHMISSFMEYSFQTRLTATSQSTAWLGQQLGDLKNQTQDLETKAIGLQRETGMFGEGDEHNMVLARLKDLNEGYTAAESNRIMKGAIYRAVLNGGAESVSGLGGTAIPGGSASPDNSLALLQSLRAQETQVRAQVAEDKTRYGSSYPKLVQTEAQLDDIQKAIREETQRITSRAENDYAIAAKSETDARAAFEKQKEIANQLNDKVIAYDMAKEEADKSRELYEGLLGKLKQADLLEGLRSSNLSVVNPGRVPSSNKPKSPNLPLYYAAGIAGGLFFGIGAAIIVDFRDKTYRTTDEVESDLGATLFGEMPAFDRKDATTGVLIGNQGKKLLDSGHPAKGRRVPVETSIYSLEYPGSAFAEAVRSLRTVLSLSRNAASPNVILVTSSTSDEGKTTLSLNLAAAYAKQGGRVLLVNGDLRKRGLDKRLGPTNCAGLSEVLSSNAEPAYCTYKDETNLTILFGGAIPPFPAELLGSERMRELVTKWRREYDFVIIDSPPVLPVTDAILLSQVADASLLIVRHGVTPRDTVQRSYRLLRQQLPTQAVLGLVMNGMPEGATRYYAYYGSEEAHLKVERVGNNVAS